MTGGGGGGAWQQREGKRDVSEMMIGCQMCAAAVKGLRSCCCLLQLLVHMAGGSGARVQVLLVYFVCIYIIIAEGFHIIFGSRARTYTHRDTGT